VVQAVGVRVYGRVRGPLITRLKVADPVVKVDQTTAALFGASTNGVVTVQVANRGNVVLTPVVHLRVTSTFGSPSTRSFSTGPLLPGESVARRFTVPVHTTGSLHAQVTAKAQGALASATSSQWNTPWGVLSSLLVVVILVVLTLVWSRRHKRRRSEEAEGRHAALSGDQAESELSPEDVEANVASEGSSGLIPGP
jgi:hypothetical protein